MCFMKSKYLLLSLIVFLISGCNDDFYYNTDPLINSWLLVEHKVDGENIELSNCDKTYLKVFKENNRGYNSYGPNCGEEELFNWELKSGGVKIYFPSDKSTYTIIWELSDSHLSLGYLDDNHRKLEWIFAPYSEVNVSN